MKVKIEKQEAAEELLYDANNDPDLQQEMLNVRFLLHRYNLLSSDRLVGRDPIVHTVKTFLLFHLFIAIMIVVYILFGISLQIPTL